MRKRCTRFPRLCPPFQYFCLILVHQILLWNEPEMSACSCILYKCMHHDWQWCSTSYASSSLERMGQNDQTTYKDAENIASMTQDPSVLPLSHGCKQSDLFLHRHTVSASSFESIRVGIKRTSPSLGIESPVSRCKRARGAKTLHLFILHMLVLCAGLTQLYLTLCGQRWIMQCAMQCTSRTTVIISSVPAGQRSFTSNQNVDPAPQSAFASLYQVYIRARIPTAYLLVCHVDNGGLCSVRRGQRLLLAVCRTDNGRSLVIKMLTPRCSVHFLPCTKSTYVRKFQRVIC